MESLASRISGQLSEKTETVILLDGIETLISVNGFDSTFRFLQNLLSEVADKKARLIMPINEKAVEREELGLLERRMNTVKIPG